MQTGDHEPSRPWKGGYVSPQADRTSQASEGKEREAREQSSSRQEAPEAVKKVRRAHVGNASVMGLRGPMA